MKYVYYQKPRSSNVPWKTLKYLLNAGVRGPNIASHGLMTFVRRQFPKQMKELNNLQRTSPRNLKVILGMLYKIIYL